MTSTDSFGAATININDRTFWVGDTYSFQTKTGSYRDVVLLGIARGGYLAVQDFHGAKFMVNADNLVPA